MAFKSLIGTIDFCSCYKLKQTGIICFMHVPICEPFQAEMKFIPLHTWRIVYCVVGIYLFTLLFTKRWFGPIALDLKKNENKMTHANITAPDE